MGQNGLFELLDQKIKALFAIVEDIDFLYQFLTRHIDASRLRLVDQIILVNYRTDLLAEKQFFINKIDYYLNQKDVLLLQFFSV
jgi:hypothetical protein